MIKYYIIDNDDGNTNIYEMTKDQIEKELNEKIELNYLEKIESTDTSDWGNKSLIIKGEIVIPRAKQKIIRYEVE